MKNEIKYTGLEIAITGISCRFPGANNWRMFWNNLVNGVESIEFTEDPNEQKNSDDPVFIRAKAVVKDKDLFDFSFFDYSPHEARLLNPVHRIFHQCVWEALEDAGYNPDLTKGPIGLYAGASEDLNWKIYSTLKNSNEDVDDFMLHLINNKDYLASLISYKLNLKGPSFVVNTACSTSLVAISLACKSLLMGETKIALAGGITIVTKKQEGYYYKEGMIYSADGHCRAFDKNATGTVSSEGAGVVVLKRLTDAINDSDHIYAIIKGTAINNDGNRKVGYTAPGVEGQAACIRKAQLFAKVEPESITYLETHGTGTKLGDPIEIEALNTAFNRNTKHRCAIGSVKTNIGHSDAAAGVAGLIKTALSLKHRKIPPSLHFNEPNPEIDFKGSPFYVNTDLKDWKSPDNSVLRAGVSSFGIGGTNAHAVLEEAPQVLKFDSDRDFKLLTLSAKTERSLLKYVDELKNFLQQEPHISLSDMSYTLQLGRKTFVNRLSLVYQSKDDLLSQLHNPALNQQIIKNMDRRDGIVFMFPGQGSQYNGLCRDLYEKEQLFREQMDHGFSIIKELTGEDFKEVLYPLSDVDDRINETKYTQPLLFLIEYSLAKLLMSLGINPRYMIGHSIGEYVAACISGVFSFEEATGLLIKRAALMSALEKGSMLSVVKSAQEAQSYLSSTVSLSAVNGAQQVVLSGDDASIDQLIENLKEAGIAHVRLQTSHAFHSFMQDGILDSFQKELEKLKFNKPVHPFISNLTGDFITDDQAMSPAYWVRHLRETVRFSEGIQNLLLADKEQVFIEVGAGHALTGLLKQHLHEKQRIIFTNLVRSSRESIDDSKYFTNRIGELWSKGVAVDWQKYYAGEKRNRISLPTYCFEPVQHPTEVDPFAGFSAGVRAGRDNRGSLKDWLYYPSWKRSVVYRPGGNSLQRQYLFLCDDEQLSNLLNDALKAGGNEVIAVFKGKEYSRVTADCYVVDPINADHFKRLLKDVKEAGFSVTNIIYSWGIGTESSKLALKADNPVLNLVYLSMVKLVQALLHENMMKEKRLVVLTNCLHSVIGNEEISYAQSLLLGLVNVLPQEYSVSCCNIDIDIQDTSATLAKHLAIEIRENQGKEDRIVAYRHGHRWIQEHERNKTIVTTIEKKLKKDGIYLITGGLGNLGFILAKHLWEKYDAKLMLTGRTELENLEKGSSKQQGRLQYLQGLSKEVKYFAADVCDESKLLQAVMEIESTTGRIDGVIHTAGIIDPKYFELIEDMTTAKVLPVLAPKVKGIENLYSIFRNRNPDFVWLSSSVAGVLGGLGYGAYSSANLYMDHFLTSKCKELPGWKCIGLAEMIFEDENAPGVWNALNTKEIIELFEWSLAAQHSPVIIETVEDLQIRIHNTYHVKKELYLDEEPEKEINAVSDKPERPSLSTPYQEPRTETEKRLTLLFEHFFGIRMIGIEDSFFELGGDSLKAMILLKRIKKEFNVQLTLNEFFGRQNISEIAFYIDEIMMLKEKKNTPAKTIVI